MASMDKLFGPPEGNEAKFVKQAKEFLDLSISTPAAVRESAAMDKEQVEQGNIVETPPGPKDMKDFGPDLHPIA